MDLTVSRISMLVAIALLYDLPAALGIGLSATRLRCGQGWLEVTVPLLATEARLVQRGALYLGEPDCPTTGQGVASGLVLLLLLRYNLTACGTQASVQGDDVVYTNFLRYTPAAQLNIIRAQEARVFLECRYHRRRNVTSGGVAPTWLPYTSARVVQQSLHFRLRVVNDDWVTDYVGHFQQDDEMRVLATVDLNLQFDFLLFIDECLAMPSPHANGPTAVIIIQNHGCLRISSGFSPGQFQPRHRPDQLGFSFQAFGFQQGSSSQVYLRCNLKVAERVTSPNAIDKACSYTPDGWVSADGNDSVCSCCNNLCSTSASAKAASLTRGVLASGYVGLGPLTVSGELAAHPGVDKRDLLRHVTTHDRSSGSSRVTSGVAVAAVLLPLAMTALVAGVLVRAKRLPLPRAITPARWQT